jgi:DNA-directed RNA polymerase specialized sigma subunit
MDGTKTAQHESSEVELLRTRQAYHDARGRRLVELLPWLRRVARSAMRRLPPRARDEEEILSEAVDEMIGLLDQWDPARAPLEGFALPRVRGRILDWARRKQHVRDEHFSLTDGPLDFDS